MDVRCNRCATEYDFDDALISERGTTVKCTNCGFQFKVFPADANSHAPERWVVRTSSGRDVVYTSLRDLQKGITEQKVGANDLLSRGEEAPRPLGSIAELEQFFVGPRLSERVQKTLHGVAPPARAPASEPRTPTPLPTERAPELSGAPRTASFGARSITTPLGTLPETDLAVTTQRTTQAPEHSANTLRMPAPASGAEDLARTVSQTPPQVMLSAPPAKQGMSATLQSIGAEPPPGRGSQPSLRGSQPNLRGSQPNLRGSQPELSSGNFGLTPDARSSPRGSQMALPPPSAGRRDLRSYDEIVPDSLVNPGRRARSRWIAAVVVVGVVALFALTVGRRYLMEARSTAAVPADSGNARVAAFLKEGDRLMDENQLEEAREQLTKASALAERDSEVLAALARLSVLQADLFWLKVRLLDPKVPELVQSTERELSRRTGRARSNVDAAFAVAPENLVVLRARVDVLRLSGDQDAAREWIKPIASQPADPENAYVLAALDLADPEPSWPTVVDRLRTAVSGERVPGRAHAALVYALTRANRLAEAEAELTKLEASPQNALLVHELDAYFQRHSDPAAVKALKKPSAAAPEPAKPERPGAVEEPARSGDFRKLLEQASAALRRDDLERADSLYQQVLAQQPGNTEALAGMGDVARRRNDPKAASRLYDRVLAENPNYVPALLASADQKWEVGDRKAALVLYRRVLDQAGPSSEYGQRASVRIAQAARAESEPTPAEPPPEPKADPSESPSEPPAIDTTDLPELQ